MHIVVRVEFAGAVPFAQFHPPSIARVPEGEEETTRTIAATNEGDVVASG